MDASGRHPAGLLTARSRAIWTEPPAALWTKPPSEIRTGWEDPGLLDLHDVSFHRGKLVFHGLEPEVERDLRLHLKPYRHFVADTVSQDRFDDVFAFATEPLVWAECAHIEERHTFFLSPWHIDNAYHLHVDNLVAMFANLRHAGALYQPRVLYVYDGDPVRNAKALQLWAIMSALFDGAVVPMRDLQSRAGRIGFRRIRWGLGPHVFYLRDARTGSFEEAAIEYQRWVLDHYGIPARQAPTDAQTPPRLLMMTRTGHRSIPNDRLIVEACRDLGLSVRAFGEWDTISVRDLVALAHGADVLIGVHGAALAHMAYMPPGSLVVELKVTSHPRTVFGHMATHLNHRHVLIGVDGEATDEGMVITPETAAAVARQIAAAWADRGRRRVVTIASLGTGNWGNEVFWYMFGKTYARRHELELQVNAWAGNTLVGASDPAIQQALPDVHEKAEHGVTDTVFPNEPPFADVNLAGYFQYHTSHYAPDRDYIRQLFEPHPDVAAHIEPGWQRLRARGRTAVAIHLRRGDYGFRYFYRTPVRWYLDQLARLWPTLDRPFLYIASDALDEVVEAFAQYGPVTAADLGPPLPAHDFYRDFYVLQHCDVILIPNSSFSFAASMLNRTLQSAYRSHLPSRGFVPFDPWNAKPIDQDWTSHVERYPWDGQLWKPTPAWKRWALWARAHYRRLARSRFARGWA